MQPEKLAVCLLASEAEPLSKTGGLADVSSALTRYLHGAGHDARLFTPCYDSIDRRALGATALHGFEQLPLVLGPNRYVYSVLRAQLPGGAPVHLIDCPALYARGAIYTGDPDEHLRFLAFTRASLETCRRMGWAPQVLHCNDWHTSFAPLYLRTVWEGEKIFAATRTVLTIHNIGYQGVFGAERIADLGLPPGASSLLHQADLAAGRINALRHGILYADFINTVSPTHALEICSEEYGMGLADSLRARGRAVSGILNGVDYDDWDPRSDRHLPQHYDPARLAVKGALKRQFISREGLTTGPDAPLAGIVSRLAGQKGIDLIYEALPKVLSDRPLGFVALGNGEPKYEKMFAQLERDFPGRVRFHCGYDDELAHWIEAACDLFLMPSRYEPCGLNQMYSLRYGTVPIVRRTGGLADSVQPYDPATGSGTGVVFNDFDPEALEGALKDALDLYARPEHWARIMKNGMAQDFSWQHQGAKYVSLYRRLLGG